MKEPKNSQESRDGHNPQLRPSYEDLWKRIAEVDDLVCDLLIVSESSSNYQSLTRILETLRGGSAYCTVCEHINALGHSCDAWIAFDKGELTLKEVDRIFRENDLW